MKLLKLFLCTICICTLCTGCVSEKHRNDMLQLLFKECLIEEDYSYVALYKVSASPIPDITSYIYTYSNGSDFVNVTIYNQVTSKDGNDSYWPVEISSNVMKKETTSVTVSGDSTTETQYVECEDSVITKHQIRRHAFLFWKWYTID